MRASNPTISTLALSATRLRSRPLTRPRAPRPPPDATAADWNQTGYAKYGGNRYGSSQSSVSTVFNFFAADDDAEFSLVDNKPAPRQRFGARRFQQRGQFQRRDQTAFVGGDVGQGASRERARQQRMQSKKQQQWNTWAYNRNRETVTYSSSVDIRPEWEVVEQVQLSELTKQRFAMDKSFAPENLGQYGELRWFDRACDQASRLQPERELVKSKKRPITPPPRTIPCSPELAEKNAGTVFATDSMVAAIMCAARSVPG